MTLNVPQLLAQIETVHAETAGWCPLSKAHELAMAVVTLRPRVTVEIGVFGGRSFLPMAMAAEAVDCGSVMAIDPWSPKESAAGYSGVNAKWWSDLNHDKIYRDFANSVAALGLTKRVEIQRVKSDDAKVPEKIDLISIDGQHTDQAILDVERFCPNVRVGGIVVADDLGWNNEGKLPIKRAVEQMLRMGFVELSRTRLDTGEEWGFFQRIKPKTK